ncbi:MAG: hypothetical protein EPN84_09090, partial [Legionella sp.]
MLEPNAMVLYVNNLNRSGEFYQDILGSEPVESSPTFSFFNFSNGMGLGLKVKTSVQPPATDEVGGTEIVFSLSSTDKVDELFKQWQKKDIAFAQLPTQLPFGYTFVALDPDDNRLRVISM